MPTRVGWAFSSGYQAALRALLPDLPAEALAALCVTEEAGNRPRDIGTRFVPQADGSVAISGAKRWTTPGPDSSLLRARTWCWPVHGPRRRRSMPRPARCGRAAATTRPHSAGSMMRPCAAWPGRHAAGVRRAPGNVCKAAPEVKPPRSLRSRPPEEGKPDEKQSPRTGYRLRAPTASSQLALGTFATAGRY